MNNRSVALLLQVEGRKLPSCSCRSLCVAVLPIKTPFTDMQFCDGVGGGCSIFCTENTFCFLFTTPLVPLTLSNCFPGLQVATPISIITRFNYLMHYLFLFVSRNSSLFCLSFLTRGVFVECLFWPTERDFLLCKVISGLGNTQETFGWRQESFVQHCCEM